MAKDIPAEKTPHMMASASPLFQAELFGLDTHFALFQLARTGDDSHADKGNQHAQQRHTTAFGANQHREVTVDDRRHQRTDNQRNADGDTNAHRHARCSAWSGHS